ncbi:MAG: hypothetical protein CVU89_13210 [Firmicutes bacterium HGW-Firmicutes-14]|jgi:hypothetical protein|nr:MAG: hypothetical protein CVU89_13210 [Firmicutes bacterium HGW-Firmicutes-14]
MKIDEPWEMLADKKIWAMLTNPENEIDTGCSRLMFIELYRRIKNLEHEANTLKVLLFLYGIIEEKVFNIALAEVNTFFQEEDDEQAKKVDFLANSGISFADWAAFNIKGKFDNNINS